MSNSLRTIYEVRWKQMNIDGKSRLLRELKVYINKLERQEKSIRRAEWVHKT